MCISHGLLSVLLCKDDSIEQWKWYASRLSTFMSVANDLLNDAFRLDNELSALAATWSLSKVQINHLGLQNPL